MAGAAGVVIIAITNNSRDNLADQDTNIASRCEPWEVFDPTLSAAGRGGENGGIDSSAIGCIRVCYVRFNTEVSWTDFPLDSDTTATVWYDRRLNARGSAEIGGAIFDLTSTNLIFSRSDEYEAPAANKQDVTLPVNGERSVDTNGNTDGDGTANIKKIDGTDGSDNEAVDNFEIRVATNQRYCEVWNNTNEQQEFRSEN